MNEMNEKPLELKIEELKSGIIELIDNSQLPLMLLTMIMKELYQDLNENNIHSVYNIKKQYEEKSISNIFEINDDK